MNAYKTNQIIFLTILQSDTYYIVCFYTLTEGFLVYSENNVYSQSIKTNGHNFWCTAVHPTLIEYSRNMHTLPFERQLCVQPPVR